MGKKTKKQKKHTVVTSQTEARSAPMSGEDMIKQATIADLKKTTIIITLLFAVEFLIFYANLMGIGA